MLFIYSIFFLGKGEIINVLTCDPGDLVNERLDFLKTCIKIRLFTREFRQEKKARV